MDLEEIMTKLANDVANNIDGALLADVLVACGWTKIKTRSQFFFGTSEVNEISDWLAVNCTGEFKWLAEDWVFEDAKDATMFALRFA